MDNDKLNALLRSLEYIENNLDREISQKDCARYACISLSGFQKLFRTVFHKSVGDYISRRRLTAAAKELQTRGASTLDIAVKYGWSSAEAFTRAFSRVWGETPTEFRKRRGSACLCPRLDLPEFFMHKGEFIMTQRYDISELYDYISSMQGTYLLSFDISHMMEINDTYGREAGDKAILECLHRIDRECAEGMMMFRIGGDEFVMLTGLTDKSAAEELAKKVLCHNGETIEHGGVSIPVNLRTGAVLLTSGRLNYSELFTELVSAPSPVAGEVKF